MSVRAVFEAVCDSCGKTLTVSTAHTAVGVRAVAARQHWVSQRKGPGDHPQGFSASLAATDLCPGCYHQYHQGKGRPSMPGCHVCERRAEAAETRPLFEDGTEAGD